MTTARVPSSSVPLIPLKDLAESAAAPSGPVMWTARPCPSAWATPRIESAAVPAEFQPFLPRLTGMTVSIAWPSLAKNGPETWPGTTPEMVVNFCASDAAFARSAAVRPDGRSYTTTAGNTLGDWNRDCRSRTLVDSALAGSHDFASLCSAPISLPASGPATPRMTIHSTRTTHLVRRPIWTLTIARALLIGILLDSAVQLATPVRGHALVVETRLAQRTHRWGAGRAGQQTRYISLALAHKIYLVNSERWLLNTAHGGRCAGPGPLETVRSHAAPRQRVLAREHVRPARFPAAIKADSPSLIMWRPWRRHRSADGRAAADAPARACCPN